MTITSIVISLELLSTLMVGRRILATVRFTCGNESWIELIWIDSNPDDGTELIAA